MGGLERLSKVSSSHVPPVRGRHVASTRRPGASPSRYWHAVHISKNALWTAEPLGQVGKRLGSGGVGLEAAGARAVQQAEVAGLRRFALQEVTSSGAAIFAARSL